MGASYLGIDVGTSSIKAAIWDAESGSCYSACSPEGYELPLLSPRPGWAEQEPENWWEHTVKAVQALPENARKDVRAIGIGYQMHGLVLVDKELKPLRPAIIWCDSRAGGIGQESFERLGAEYCFEHLLNSPGNFTAAKLAWVARNEPDVLAREALAFLPGDFIAAKLTGLARTTRSGLSEMTLWDFKEGSLAAPVLESMGLSGRFLCEIVPTFGSQGSVDGEVCRMLGIGGDSQVAYRAGDQPNNAFSLGCLNAGDTAATAGTSGVVYGVSDEPVIDRRGRFNTFIHVNHTVESPRYGLLLCINGCGSLYSWMRKTLFPAAGYGEMNAWSAEAPPGSDGLRVYPFGNGAERILGNEGVFASFRGLDFARHDRRQFCRAAQEGIAFALRYGMETGIRPRSIRAGNANLFLSPVFAQTVADLTDAEVEIWDTDGALGAARGAAVGDGMSVSDVLRGVQVIRRYEPGDRGLREAYEVWKSGLATLAE